MKNNFGPKIVFPKDTNKWISRNNGLVVEVCKLDFVVKINGMPDGVTDIFSKRLLPGRKVSVGDCFSVFWAKVWIVGINLNGKKVFYRDPHELGLEFA